MNETPALRELADRLMTQKIGKIGDAAGRASYVVEVFTTFITSMSSLVGEIGSAALFRRSLSLTNAGFPFYAEALGNDQDGTLNAVGLCLRKQAPEVILEASVALLAACLELLASFIGLRLTQQLVLEAWPELLTASSAEEQHA